MSQLISDLANFLSREECVTASCLKPWLNHLHVEALAEKEKDTTLKSIQQEMKGECIKVKCTTNSPQEACMNIEKHVKEELSHYLGCNQPDINSSPFKW